MRQLIASFGLILLLAPWRVALGIDDNIYGEEGWPEYKEGPAWREQEVTLPVYPDNKALIEVDLPLKNFPFTLLIDSRSLGVGDDRVVRYAVILRSKTGAENAFYEGVRCSEKEYRRYAYGSGGAFKRIENSEWRPVSSIGTDRYRAVLMQEYFCPLPGYDREAQILKRLKDSGRRRGF